MRPPGGSPMERIRNRRPAWPLLLALAVFIPDFGATGPVADPPDITVRILYTGNCLGYIDPCDCSRGRLGGLDRRAAALAAQREDGVPILLLDLGNLFELPTRYPTTELGRRQAAFLAKEMAAMGYRLQALGSKDLILPSEFLAEHLAALPGPFILTNRAPEADIGVATVPRVRVELGGLTIDILNVVDPEMVPREGILTPWELALREALARSSTTTAGESPADLQLVITHVPFNQVDRIPGRFPEADLVLDGALLLPRQALRIEDTVVMSTSGKGQHLGVLNLRISPLAEQRRGRPAVLGFQGLNIDLPMDYPVDPAVRARMDAFRTQLIKDGLILP
jgi:2',3'-cyclic-nucleotide 2'-phosphodiesterase (5'-nucleotidase family)